MTSSSRPRKVRGSWRVKKAERLLRPKTRLVVSCQRSALDLDDPQGPSPLLVKRS
jgi:hypothetical protein